jgi:hypothetical protein
MELGLLKADMAASLVEQPRTLLMIYWADCICMRRTIMTVWEDEVMELPQQAKWLAIVKVHTTRGFSLVRCSST